MKSNKTSLRPGLPTQNPLGRGRHATDTSSLSCCSINFVLSHDFLQQQFQHFYAQKTLHIIDKLFQRFPFYSAVYDQEQHIDSDETNLLLTSVLNAHEFGLTFYHLYQQVKSSMAFGECVKQLNDYLVRGIVIAAGSRTRIFVHRKHARSWLIYSIRFRQQDDNNNNNLETLLTSAFVESPSTSKTSAMDIQTTQDDRQMKLFNFSNGDTQLISDQCEVRHHFLFVQI